MNTPVSEDGICPRPGFDQRSLVVLRRLAERAGYSDTTARSDRFEYGDLDAGRSQTRVSALEARVDALREQDLALGEDIATREPTTPEAADLAGVAEQLEDVIGAGDPKQAKALLRLLIKDLRVNGRREILPTYRVVAPEVCALPSSAHSTHPLKQPEQAV